MMSSKHSQHSSTGPGGGGSNTSSNGNKTDGGFALGLLEVLEEAELSHHHHGLETVLGVQSLAQLKHVADEDLYHIGMSKPEARRLKALYGKTNVTAKLKKLFGGGSSRSREQQHTDCYSYSKSAQHEFLLPEEESVAAATRTMSTSSTSASASSSLDNQMKRNRRHSSALSSTSSSSDNGNNFSFTSGNGSAPFRVPPRHIIPVHAIVVHKELGQGEFGVVQQGVWTDGENGTRRQVAVKCLAKERMQNNTAEFLKEYEIMQAIDHPSIVRLFGVCLDAAKIMLVTELAPLRSLWECLQETGLRASLTVPVLTEFAGQICQGMIYLEQKRLIHRDLAARNILVFSKSVVKISDFGLSRALGVGKDYYQTNFNMNLKLPVAWCAPECISFLKFTSASDVWAFGVTLWEMFSYGFQPWAALTGRQILETIDQPRSQRLEQPVHCPREYYTLMLQCWSHEPSERPTFEHLGALLDDARPERVQAVARYAGGETLGQTQMQQRQLIFDMGDVITVLDKHSDQVWSGALDNGRVGYFSPRDTVAYIGMMPSSQAPSGPKWGLGGLAGIIPEEPASSSNSSLPFSSSFQRNSLRSSSRRKISRDMISGPRGEVKHTGHIGVDGAFFGNVGDFNHVNAGNKLCKASSERAGLNSVGSSHPPSSLSRAESDASERAPLLSTSTMGSNPSSPRDHIPTSGLTSGTTVGGVNKNPRIGYAIGYPRKSSGAGLPVTSSGGVSTDPAAAATASSSSKHEYHSISDDEFGGPLDLGPSLMDEVFSELDSSRDSGENNNEGGPTEDAPDGGDAKSGEVGAAVTGGGRGRKKSDLREFVSSTLTLASMSKNKKKKQQLTATVKPIKASDEKILEDAIAMAHNLANKSMQVDRRRTEGDFYQSSPPPVLPSPSPSSPSKKGFKFLFPSSGGSHGGRLSPRSGERKPFSDDCKAPADFESMVTPGAKDAYKQLIDGMRPAGSIESLPSKTPPRSADSLRGVTYPATVQDHAQVQAHAAHSAQQHAQALAHAHAIKQQQHTYSNTDVLASSNNPLPLPPKSQKLTLSQPPKRHVRKNPLIIPSGMAASVMQRRAEEKEEEEEEQKKSEPRQFDLNRTESRTGPSTSSHSQTLPSSYSSRSSRLGHGGPYNGQDDAFENEIACSMDALDQLDQDSFDVNSPKHSLDPTQQQASTTPLVVRASTEHQGRRLSKPGARGEGSDEVRIMKKVLSGMPDLESAACVSALDATEWNVHHAIKLIKVKTMIRAPGLSDAEMRVALQTRDWDVQKAAGVLMKKIKE